MALFLVEAFTEISIINVFLYTPSVHKNPNNIRGLRQVKYLYLGGTNHSSLI